MGWTGTCRSAVREELWIHMQSEAVLLIYLLNEKTEKSYCLNTNTLFNFRIGIVYLVSTPVNIQPLV